MMNARSATLLEVRESARPEFPKSVNLLLVRGTSEKEFPYRPGLSMKKFQVARMMRDGADAFPDVYVRVGEPQNVFHLHFSYAFQRSNGRLTVTNGATGEKIELTVEEATQITLEIGQRFLWYRKPVIYGKKNPTISEIVGVYEGRIKGEETEKSDILLRYWELLKLI